MRISTLSAVLATLTLFPAAVVAQQVYGGPDEDRQASTVLIFGDNALYGAASISYSQPMWQDEYDEKFDELKGRMVRLGKNWWTTLQTATPMQFGDKKIEAGSYVLGLECDKQGGFHLLVIDANLAMQQQMMPWSTDNWKPGTKVALTLQKDASEDATEQMEIELTAKKDATGTFAIRWGTHELGADVKYLGGSAKEASAEKKDMKEKTKEEMKK